MCMQPPAGQPAVADAFTAAIDAAIAQSAAVAAVAEQTQARSYFSGVHILC